MRSHASPRYRRSAALDQPISSNSGDAGNATLRQFFSRRNAVMRATRSSAIDALDEHLQIAGALS
jgi:hypothetical protein